MGQDDEMVKEAEVGGDEEPQLESSPRESEFYPSPTKTQEGSSSYKTAHYESHEMKRLMALHVPDEKFATTVEDVTYKPADVFPEWVLTNPTWAMVSKIAESDNEISNILQIPVQKRSQDEVSALIHWLMSVWKIADTMGFKRCGSMFKEFKYKTYEAGEDIIREGDRGLVFYIIVSGMTTVEKEGIGVVGQLGKGKGFGEVALTQGKDLRTATVRAQTRVEVLSLHKINYDFFVRDIQEAEKRENFHILAHCKLFKSWPKAKVEKMCNSCLRKTFEPDTAIFKQGDPPEDLYIVVEGAVNIIKELVIVCKNRWPTSINSWGERTKKIHKPIILSTINRGGFFGEIAIIKDVPRSTSAVTTQRTVLISLDKREFLHLISYGKATYAHSEEPVDIQKYVDDRTIIDTVNHIKGGPKSQVEMGDLTRNKDQVDALGIVKHEDINLKATPTWRNRKQREQNHSLHASIASNSTSRLSEVNLQKEVQKATKSNALADKLRANIKEGLQSDRATKEKIAKFEEFKRLTDSNHKGSLLRLRIENARRGSSVGFAAHNKRQSLAGLDNDPAAHAHSVFGGKVVLRRNSSVQIDMLYNDFYRKLQTNKMHGLATPDAQAFMESGAKLPGGAGQRNSILNSLRGVATAQGGRRPQPSDGGDRYNLDRSSSFFAKQPDGLRRVSRLEATAEIKEEEGEVEQESSEEEGPPMLTRRPFTSPVTTMDIKKLDDQSIESSEIELFDMDGNQVSPELIALARRKSMQANTAGAVLKFRNKSILTFRDAMEG